MLVLTRAAGPKRKPIEAAYIGGDGDPINRSAYTFSSQAIGDAASDRVVVVAVFVDNNDISSVTLGGVTMTVAGDGLNGASRLQLCYAEFPAGTEADIVVTLAGSAFSCTIGVWSFTGGQDTPTVTEADVNETSATSGSIAVEAGGAVFGAVCTRGTGSDRITFTGVTEDAEVDSGEGPDLGLAHDEHAVASTVAYSFSVTSDANNGIGIFVSFE